MRLIIILISLAWLSLGCKKTTENVCASISKVKVNSSYTATAGARFALRPVDIGGGTSYQWRGPRGFELIAVNLIFDTVKIRQQGRYFLSVQNSEGGCALNDTFVLDVKLPPSGLSCTFPNNGFRWNNGSNQAFTTSRITTDNANRKVLTATTATGTILRATFHPYWTNEAMEFGRFLTVETDAQFTNAPEVNVVRITLTQQGTTFLAKAGSTISVGATSAGKLGFGACSLTLNGTNDLATIRIYEY